VGVARVLMLEQYSHLPYRVTLPAMPLHVKIIDSPPCDWCFLHCALNWEVELDRPMKSSQDPFVIWTVTYYFESVDDAVHFRLTWS
jgi:hypothetical protein